MPERGTQKGYILLLRSVVFTAIFSPVYLVTLIDYTRPVHPSAKVWWHTPSVKETDLPKLDLWVDRGSDFAAWKLQWDSYRSLSGLTDQTTAKQVQALTLCFFRETPSVVPNLGLTEEQRASVVCTIKQSRHHFCYWLQQHQSLP